MYTYEIAGIALVLAIAFIVTQQVVIHKQRKALDRFADTLMALADSSMEISTDPDGDVHVTKKGR
tara:strand:- start:808 stop:1002 length:195 start_codon:yes stop_codon:yes gene_type:complete